MIEELESQRVLQSFFGGASELIGKKDELNKINVFPVADGDTGSNLASLMQSILDSVAPDLSSVEKVLVDVADAALMGARGNSGIIFAQYLHAISQFFAQSEKNTGGFVQALNQGVSEAYRALLEPKEGTILTVMRVWAEAVHQTFSSDRSLEKALVSAREKAYGALIQTEFQMDILRKNRLVDSGAKGFYFFIDGFTSAFSNQLKVVPAGETVQSAAAFQTESVVEKPVYRYCTELLVKNVSTGKEQLKKEFEDFGDSLILAGNQNMLKIHIHTNNPQEILKTAAQFGEVTQQKVDDMLLQFEVTKKRKYPIAVVTDSIADLPKDFLLEEQIHVLPINILIDEASYLDKLTVDSLTIKEQGARNKRLSTAQPSVKTVDALLSFLENRYEAILVITVSAQLSGTYQLVKQRMAAKGLSAEKIQVIDSRLNSAAQGLLVREAVFLLKQGRSLQEIVQALDELRKNCFIYVAVADLTPMLRSGRIPKGLGKAAQRLHLYPIVSLNSDGNGKLSGIAFSQQQSEQKIIKKVQRLIKKKQLNALAIAHSNNEKEAEVLRQHLNKQKSAAVDFIVESSAAIAISAGVGSVAVAGIRKG